ncbi:MAG: 30S ribosomal protein S2 [Patescibacteria group bacterium]|nr:30S ribosomal protein S2 [Patescibacteria group bacterium]MBU4142176.1 30S ribosomal protein S2 [Patescibacteria group bacterium]
MEMLKAGVHFGHRTMKWSPKMAPFIFGVRNDTHIIDLEKTIIKLNEALVFVKKLAKNNGVIIFVGTKKQAKAYIKEVAIKANMPYVADRWIGGLLTNFSIISKQIRLMEQLETDLASGALDKYTKKERVMIEKKIKKLNQKFGGLRLLKKLPDAIFVTDINEDRIAVNEAREKNIPIIALADTNTDPGLVAYPIPANDDALSSIKIIVNKIAEEYEKGKAE